MTNATDAPATQRAPIKSPESEALMFGSMLLFNQKGEKISIAILQVPPLLLYPEARERRYVAGSRERIEIIGAQNV